MTKKEVFRQWLSRLHNMGCYVGYRENIPDSRLTVFPEYLWDVLKIIQCGTPCKISIEQRGEAYRLEPLL